ncbi:MAG: NYN domain-containing protein [Bacteroidetes bacterium]|nr:NYN domain-containing protein [Bacteroidota bacterium]
MKHHWIIDAYNVIHRIPRFRSRLGTALEQARASLLKTLQGFARSQRASCTVVFDGADVASQLPDRAGGLNIAFAKPPRKADDVIKKLVDDLKNRSQITVVSSDLEVYRYAKASGCKVMTSEEFDAKVRARVSSGESDQKEEPNLSAGEKEEWLNLFK